MTTPRRARDPSTAHRFRSVDELLAAARAELVRLDPQQARAAIEEGGLLVDIRPAWQRAREGEIPGSLIVERNHLEWRLHPDSPARLPQASAGQRWIVVCSQGYTSSLAAHALQSLQIPATDLVGGFSAWRAAHLPVTHGVTVVDQIVGVGPRITSTTGLKAGAPSYRGPGGPDEEPAH